jgi:hypothetical protein
MQDAAAEFQQFAEHFPIPVHLPRGQ